MSNEQWAMSWLLVGDLHELAGRTGVATAGCCCGAFDPADRRWDPAGSSFASGCVSRVFASLCGDSDGGTGAVGGGSGKPRHVSARECADWDSIAGCAALEERAGAVVDQAAAA